MGFICFFLNVCPISCRCGCCWFVVLSGGGGGGGGCGDDVFSKFVSF